MSDWQQHDIDVNGINLHYTRTGGVHLPVLIAAHGFADSGLCWYRVANQLAPFFNVVMYDARNHGLSGQGEATLVGMIEDLKGLVEALDLETPPVLLGHSMGASTVASFVAQFPELARAVILEDPPWWFAMDQEKTEEQKEHQKKKQREGFERYLQEVKSKSYDELLSYGRDLYPDWHDEDLPDWATAKLHVKEAAIDGLSLPNWHEVALDIKVPTLLVHSDGARDGLLKPDLVVDLMKRNSSLTGAQIRGAGHNIRRENFPDYMEALNAFLAQQLSMS